MMDSDKSGTVSKPWESGTEGPSAMVMDSTKKLPLPSPPPGDTNAICLVISAYDSHQREMLWYSFDIIDSDYPNSKSMPSRKRRRSPPRPHYLHEAHQCHKGSLVPLVRVSQETGCCNGWSVLDEGKLLCRIGSPMEGPTMMDDNVVALELRNEKAVGTLVLPCVSRDAIPTPGPLVAKYMFLVVLLTPQIHGVRSMILSWIVGHPSPTPTIIATLDTTARTCLRPLPWPLLVARCCSSLVLFHSVNFIS